MTTPARRSAPTLPLFVGLLAFWFVLSDQHNPLFIGIGVVSAALVTWLTRGLVGETLGERLQPARPVYQLWRVLVYLVWLIGRIGVASTQVAYFVLHPKVPLDPALIRFSTPLRSRLARTILANSITLVPGTMTVGLDEGTYVVHALVPAATDDLRSGQMQTMIAKIFLEGEQPAPEVEWLEGARP